MATQLALHTWTLDTTPLADTLRVMRETGWSAVELRRLDFTRATEANRPPEIVLELVRASGLPVACVGVELGWMWTRGEDRQRLLRVFVEQCQRAVALGCATVMSPVDRGTGALPDAAASVREVGDIAATHGLRLALEANSQAEQVNTLERLRELIARAGHPHCGLLFDTYHFQRSGGRLSALEDVAGEEIFYVQYSDVPATGLEPGKVLNRLPPGYGIVPFKELFRLLVAKGYTGYLSYEAPNTAAWGRPALDVAREALTATRAVLP
ncbi:MAG: sugar phosphate isomerase/epimerase family protein [Candidatus Rokuibacteriota bacterium]